MPFVLSSLSKPVTKALRIASLRLLETDDDRYVVMKTDAQSSLLSSSYGNWSLVLSAAGRDEHNLDTMGLGVRKRARCMSRLQ